MRDYKLVLYQKILAQIIEALEDYMSEDYGDDYYAEERRKRNNALIKKAVKLMGGDR